MLQYAVLHLDLMLKAAHSSVDFVLLQCQASGSHMSQHG